MTTYKLHVSKIRRVAIVTAVQHFANNKQLTNPDMVKGDEASVTVAYSKHGA